MMTFPLSVDDDMEASLFISPDPDFVFGGNMGRVMSGPGIEVVRHARSRRCRGSKFDSLMSEHPLLISEPSDDDVAEEDGSPVPYSGHKIGGHPYFVHGEPKLEGEVNTLLQNGFCQSIQIDFPGNIGDDEVSGAWPLGTGLVHILCRITNDGAFQWRAFWED